MVERTRNLLSSVLPPHFNHPNAPIFHLSPFRIEGQRAVDEPLFFARISYTIPISVYHAMPKTYTRNTNPLPGSVPRFLKSLRGSAMMPDVQDCVPPPSLRPNH